ncbi:UNVERIFIED_CONTAM: hypothetical protein Scaly_2224500 [Sesamum calycinum]|uniref:Endonuclease/exonuclease/phosphatase domain-containing protein n=1 Tax=Sesamum calycinum TaxID=2727403 RepID=A0AAW2M8V4_9LAMI
MNKYKSLSDTTEQHLPLEILTEEGLSTVASGVGTPLYTDGITKECSRLDYARCVVMLNSHLNLPITLSYHLRELWGGLRTLAVGISDEPWLVLGDFNAVLDDSEVRGRAADTSVSMAEFRTCILDTGLVQLPFTGCPYTWHNCSEGTRSLWKRLDRMLVNEAWLEKWPGSSYISALPSTSDHSPLIISGTNGEAERPSFGLTTI